MTTTSSTRPGTVSPMLTRKNSTQPSSIGEPAARGRQDVDPDRRERGQQRVLRRGERDIAQPRQIGDEGGRSDAVGQVLGADRQGQHDDIVTGPDLHDVHQVRQRLQHAADQQRAEDPEPQHHDPADRHPGQGRDHAVDLGDRRDLDLGETERDIKRVRHRPGDRLAEFVEDHKGQDQDQPGRAAAPQHVGERRDDGAAQPRRRSARRRSRPATAPAP